MARAAKLTFMSLREFASNPGVKAGVQAAVGRSALRPGDDNVDVLSVDQFLLVFVLHIVSFSDFPLSVARLCVSLCFFCCEGPGSPDEGECDRSILLAGSKALERGGREREVDGRERESGGMRRGRNRRNCLESEGETGKQKEVS